MNEYDNEDEFMLNRAVRQLRALVNTAPTEPIRVHMTKFIALMNTIVYLVKHALDDVNRRSGGIYEQLLDDLITFANTLHDCEMTLYGIRGYNREL